MNSTSASSPFARLPRTIFWATISLAAGLVGGVLLHYLIYRLSLPTEPFIYVSF
jgi:hypothetical protein